MAIYCNQCGAQLADGSNFCNKCGARQPGPENAAAPSPLRAPAAPAKDEPEVELWKSTPSARAWSHYWLLCILVMIAAAWLTWSAVIRWDWALVMAAAPLLFTIAVIGAAKLSTRYRLTNQRIFVDKGVFSRNITETELIRIDDVAVRQNLIQRMFRVGVVILSAADSDDSHVELEGIDNPIEVKETIRALVRKQQARVLRTQAV